MHSRITCDAAASTEDTGARFAGGDRAKYRIDGVHCLDGDHDEVTRTLIPL